MEQGWLKFSKLNLALIALGLTTTAFATHPDDDMSLPQTSSGKSNLIAS